MKALDGNTIRKKGMPSLVLMERAALAVTEELEKNPRRLARVLVVCGSGNNGGDGFAIARILHLHGYQSEIFFTGNPEHMTEETLSQKKIADNYQVPMVNNPRYEEYTTIVDAMFGVGLSREIQGNYRKVIEGINESGAYCVAVDIPSGISGDTGRVLGIAVKADLTVTFAFLKRGHCLYPGAAYSGEIKVKDIGIYEDGQEEELYALEAKDCPKLLPARKPWGHKGTFGKVLVVGGSKGMSGAAYFSAKAVLAAGAGMVKLQTVEENRPILQMLLPEGMVASEDTLEEWSESLRWCDVLVIGPGLGRSEESCKRAQWFLKESQERKLPVVLDADGLNLLACHPQWYSWIQGRCVVTPHLGEMSRLVKEPAEDIGEHLIASAQAFAREKQVVCILKDARTVIAYPDGRTYLNMTGNSGMATAGSGDVLAGFVGGLLAVGREKKDTPLEALGVFLHGAAGDKAKRTAGESGMTAEDILDAFSQVLEEREEI